MPAALFELVLDVCRANNLKISLAGLDFWDEFKLSLKNVLTDEELQ